LLSAVNSSWIDHIDAMDQLRKGIVLRAYAQVDPVIAYKQEGHEMFEEMIYRIQKYTVARLLKTEWVFEKPKVAEAGEMMSIPMRAPKPATQPAAQPATQAAEQPAAQPAEQPAEEENKQ
jgi:preprotein translocase subunit SecA